MKQTRVAHALSEKHREDAKKLLARALGFPENVTDDRIDAAVDNIIAAAVFMVASLQEEVAKGIADGG